MRPTTHSYPRFDMRERSMSKTEMLIAVEHSGWMINAAGYLAHLTSLRPASPPAVTLGSPSLLSASFSVGSANGASQ